MSYQQMGLVKFVYKHPIVYTGMPFTGRNTEEFVNYATSQYNPEQVSYIIGDNGQLIITLHVKKLIVKVKFNVGDWLVEIDGKYKQLSSIEFDTLYKEVSKW